VGSGWKDYQRTGEVCGHRLPEGLRESEELATPLFTPSTKAEEGHDEISVKLRQSRFWELRYRFSARDIAQLYNDARAYARSRNIIIADTKFEFGRDASGQIILVDEALTPDSSRFWPLEGYAPGISTIVRQTVRP